jgi:hypothetical protein
MNNVLRFGIPTLDRLINDHPTDSAASELGGIDISKGQRRGSGATTSVCILGPNGTGKSLLAMHLTSRYVADCIGGITEGGKKGIGEAKNGETEAATGGAPRNADLSQEGSQQPNPTPGAACGGEDAEAFVPQAFYISTDLKTQMAEGTWQRFYLDKPNQRAVPFASARNPYPGPPDLTLTLKPCDVADHENDVSAYLSQKQTPEKPEVAFLDLASSTAGDDWGFVNRLLAVVKPPPDGAPRHLMVIDAVEGLETLVGERDAFGEIASRRARITQIMRAAADKCHVVFIVEEPTPIERLPEEFVADVVIHLRNSVVKNYSRRTVEIEKVRGQSHVRGQHPFVIRAGRGSTTGQDPNWDDPEVMCEIGSQSKPAGDKETDKGNDQGDDEAGKIREKAQSYFHVFPSLHLLSRQIMEDKQKERSSPPEKFAGFGIRFLDEMLAGNTRTKRKRGEHFSPFGLQCSTVTALIGDPMTQKTELGRAFLSQAFVSYAERLWDLAQELFGPDRQKTGAIRDLLGKNEFERLNGDFSDGRLTNLINEKKTNIADFRVRNRLGEFDAIKKGNESVDPVELAWELLECFETSGEAVLLTTQDLHADGLAKEFGSWVFEEITKRSGNAQNVIKPDSFQKMLKEHIKYHTVCRRLEIHDQSSPILVHIVSEAIKKAQESVFLPKGIPPQTTERFEKSGRIRIVIDDFSALCEMYPEIRDDALFLPYLLFHLGREGVTSLIIDTQPGRPEMAGPGPLATELRTLVQSRLYTWRVPFYREHRIAIAAIPPLCRDVPAVVRELRWAFSEGGNPDLPIVDPHFELYSGLAEGRPQAVPLQVRLYKENEAFAQYIEQENNLFRELFTPLTSGNEKAEVIVGEAVTGYDNLRDFSYLQRDTQLDYTLVFQIDEFWALKDQAPLQLRSQWDYLNAETVNAKGERDEFVDPFGLFQHTEGSPAEEGKNHRYCFFNTMGGYDLRTKSESLDRVPFTWDFGFLLCREHLWENAKSQNFCAGGTRFEVKDVWDALPKAVSNSRRKNDKKPPQVKTAEEERREEGARTWRVFFQACKEVAKMEALKTSKPVPSFDLATISRETFSCLLLEVWGSEIYDDYLKDQPNAEELLWRFPEKLGLVGMIELSRLQLFKAWLLLFEVLDVDGLLDPARAFEIKVRAADPRAPASRHWYKTASEQTTAFSGADPVIPVRLPGHWSVRGDWFLAVARGSRSGRAADHALDILSSRRANITRLQLGLGLPTRNLIPKDQYGMLRTKLISHDEEGSPANVEYGSLISIGGRTDDTKEEFHWGWRSKIRNYVRHARIWQKWLTRMLIEFNRLRFERGHQWLVSGSINVSTGFELYDKIQELKPTRPRGTTGRRTIPTAITEHPVWIKFDQMRAFLLEELKQATPKPKPNPN